MYNYEMQKKELFTEEGSIMFTRIRDNTLSLLDKAGAVMMEKAICGTGDMWTMIACLDRMVELGEICELKRNCAGQHRVFVKA